MQLDLGGIRTVDDLAGTSPALRQPDVQLVRDLLVPLASALSGEGHVAHVAAGPAFVRLALVVDAVLKGRCNNNVFESFKQQNNSTHFECTR